MSLKRKLFILILGVVMVLSLALVMTGCGSSSGGTDTGTNTNTNTNTNNPSESGYTITILDSSDETVATVTLTDEEDNDISSIDTTKTGYKFLGFYTADGIQIFDAKGKQASGIIIDHEYTLYLRYSVKTYTFVYYVYNDDSKSYEVYKEQSYEYDTEIVNFENAPSKTGQDFVGWAKSSSGNSLYSSGTTPTNSVFNSTNYTISSDEVKLYAKYQAKKMTVTLVYNNASLNKADVTFEVDYGSTLPDLSKYSVDCDGYELVGWSKYSYQYTEYTSTITSSIALYGYWREYKYISLVYSSTESVAYKVYNISGESCMLPEDATIPGYTLEGWYTNKNYTGNPVTGSQYNLLADTYYAKWNIVTYTITFEYDGEDFDDITYTVESDAITLPDIEIYGYNFYGWCTNSSLSGTPITKFVPSTSKGGYGDITLYPKLEKYSSTINYYLNSSKLGSITVEYGENYSIPVSSSRFGTDKLFEYWYMEDDDGKLVVLTDDDGDSLAKWNYLGSDYYVYAEYEQLYSVTLKYTNPTTNKVVSNSYGYFHVGDELTINAESFSNYGVTGYYINDTLVSSADYFTYTVEASNVTIIAEYSYKIAKEFATEYGFPYTVYCYNGHYYAIIESSKTWSNAEKWCEFYGGHLVTLTSSGENSFVGSILTDFASSSKYWIGANDVSVEGTWVWVTGEKWSYTNWASGEPNNSSNQDYAAIMVSSYLWDDDGNASSSTSFPFVIEWDSIDSYITTVTETLTDVNGEEVTLTLYKYNSHYYAVVDTSMLWTVAEAYSEYIGGHLVTITSSDENNFVGLLLSNASAGSANYWLGGTDYEVEGTWKWVTGETWSYTNWESSQPDNSQSNQDYPVIHLSGYGWDDAYNTGSYPFIIEWESLSDVGTIKQLYEIKYISTASEFLEIQNNTAGYYILESDIKLTTAWTPVDFSGYLIGNGHTVSGITVESSGNAGVFLTVTGTIENITFEVTVNSTSTSKVYVGGAVAQLNGGTLKDITVKGTVSSVSGTAYIGGVVGIYSTGTISGLTNYATVNSSTTTDDVGAGGVIGHADSYDLTDLTNYGNVTSYGDVGGVIGFMHIFYNGGTTAVISGLKNYGSITNNNTTGSCGGIFGDLRNALNSSSSYSVTISDCYNYGSVTTKNSYAGGVVAFVKVTNSGSGAFTFAGYNLYNEGNVTCDGHYAGGIIGYGEAKTNTSYISGTSSAKVSGQYYVGGVAGYLSNIAVKDSSNAGSTVTATSYMVSSSTNYVYLGGYVGYGYSVSGCVNAVDINYILSDSVYYVGGIAGYLTGTANNCSNSGNISGAYSVGGIVGEVCNGSGGTMTSLTNTGSISGVRLIGGIFGEVTYSNSVSSLVTFNISNLTNSGDITASSYSAGGIAGKIYLNNTHSSYSYILYATNLENTGNVTGGYNVGGIVGYGYAESTLSYITQSSSTASVTGLYYVGGIAGRLEYISLSYCDNSGSTISAYSFTNDGTGNCVGLGGYVGYGYEITVSHCDNAVDIDYSGGDYKYVGGIAGCLRGGINNCTNSGKISSTSFEVGGLVGTFAVSSSVTVESLTNNGTVVGSNHTGGVFGLIWWDGSVSANIILTMKDVTNNGAVTVSGDQAGGIVGRINLKNTHSSYIITIFASNLTNTGAVTGASYVGGIVGYGYTEGTSSYLQNCVNSGTITGTSNYDEIYGYLSNITVKN